MTNGPSAHLTWEELSCWDKTTKPWRLIAVYPIDYRDDRLPPLAKEFEAVRTLLAARAGRIVPLRINSAYRTVAYNRRVGGKPLSQHVEGRALDIAPADPALLDMLHDVVVTRAEAAGVIRGVGIYDTFVHMDTRPTERLSRWDLRKERK